MSGNIEADQCVGFLVPTGEETHIDPKIFAGILARTRVDVTGQLLGFESEPGILSVIISIE